MKYVVATTFPHHIYKNVQRLTKFTKKNTRVTSSPNRVSVNDSPKAYILLLGAQHVIKNVDSISAFEIRLQML